MNRGKQATEFNFGYIVTKYQIAPDPDIHINLESINQKIGILQVENV